MAESKETVLITGGTGMIGTRLVKLLEEEGYEPLILTRSKQTAANSFHWNVKEKVIEREALERADHIIHLAGAGIADERWTKKRKKIIIDSRLKSADLIFNSLKKWDISVKTFLSTSAIGYYGDKGNERVTEDSKPGNGFLSEVCLKWENATDQFKSLGIRTAKLRIGLVLSREGGMLMETYRPLKFGAAPYFGDGSQYYSWVHIEDVCRGFIHLLKQKKLEGAFNMVAPEPVSNKEFMKILKSETGKAAVLFGVPTFALNLIFGEMSHALLDSLKVSSGEIVETGFKFRYNSLDKALSNLLSK